MTRSDTFHRTSWKRLALLFVGCALLLRVAVPAGWMPQVSGSHVTLSWCADSGFSGPSALAEAKALLADALGQPKHDKTKDQPCAFAMAAQPLAPADPVALPHPLPAAEPVRHARLEPAPGRGLAAPPPLATGPPLLG
ncbi:hypothetical protein RZN05_07495 [Sphingomonas sp. HF-S4]|uniref:DUF2946 domain-containing protein n=1 Tax=Sphingomonas agrestis TaxID=3080540 RepID=A0ABU3Y6U9_9SPHN|nr:hypothetical protein [Sphingomonas sp. HF-S4]MDV3456822.1 hypothetical protein [Sphingomonas sp. HF-S4]